MRKMGHIATGMLVSLIKEGEATNQVHEVATRLIVRDSCGGIR